MFVRGYRVDAEVSRDELHVLCRGARESDGRRVLLKLPVAVSPAALAVSRREHDILVGLDVSGVPRALAFDEATGAVVLADGGGVPLQSALALARPDLAAFFATAIPLAATVHELHARRIIHRNLSPASVLVEPRLARPEIFDFSVASRLPHDSQAPHPLRLLPGRLAYIAPEQTGRMNRVVDHRSDLYSLGVIFYQMLTGEVPFESKDPLEIVHGHLARIARAPEEIDGTIPAPLSALVMKLLAKTAEERYQSAAGLKADLEVCAAEWAEERSIRVFPLGGRDRSDRFTIPERLYGRDAEVRALLEAFETASSGPARLMLVAGYPGVGKTSLVNEVHKPIVKRRGRFVSGKFDQLDRNIPYGALVQAFRGLIRQVLAESEETIAGFRERLAGALEAGAGVMTEVIPELEILLGPQPPTPPLGPAEAQNRFTYLFQNFIQTFAGAEHPLVVFLDDLQWADPATLRLLAFLVTSPGVRSLFIIGAYRDNEVGPAHPLAQTIAEVRGVGAAIDAIHLLPLRLGHLTALVADTLQCDELAASSLAQLVLRKTDGNPFFVTQFLGLLHSEGLIRFDHALGRFVFDLERIEAASITENVIDLMTSKLKKLSAPTRQVIALGACVGSSFSLRTLATVREKGLRETAAELWESIVEGLVVPTSSRYELFASASDEVLEDLAPAYRFLHDRVQQAAYALIPDGLKAPVHLRVGRLLLAG
ncbi:MAG: AAA family ATPase, partial [Acidobacteria bacterium]|nr:AAA family ATPase [Acidobacteriota bacterium]